MNKAVLLILAMAIIGCFTNRENVIYPLSERDLLLFLNSSDWKLIQICVDGNCEETINDEEYPFGIDTENAVINYCTNEKGYFYTIGKYHSFFDPETFEKRVAIFSCPDYFKISEFGNNGNEIKINLCTPYGYYSSTLKIIDAETIQIVANRPEYKKMEVIQVYKKR